MNARFTPLAAALALGLTLAVMPAQAQTKKELVAKIVDLQKAEIQAVAGNLANQMIAPLVQDVQVLLGQQPADKRDALAREIQADIQKFGGEAVPILRERALKIAPTAIGGPLEEAFSEDELKQLVTMLESPAYVRWRQMSGEFGQALAQKTVADARPALEPKVRALQQSVGKRLGLEPRAAASAPAAKPASGKK